MARQTTIETELARIRARLTWLILILLAALVAAEVRNHGQCVPINPQLPESDSPLQIESTRADDRSSDLESDFRTDLAAISRQTLLGTRSKIMGPAPVAPVDELEHLTVAALRAAAKQRGLATSGNRSALLSRLREAPAS